MSPEQARGLPVDRRTDVWSFGCLLFEALSGRRPFPGSTVSDTIAAILEREPDWAALPAATPPGIRRLLRRSLDKDLRRRLRYLDPAQLDAEEPSGVVPALATVRSRGWVAPAVGLFGCATAFALGYGLARREPPPAPGWTRQAIVIPVHPPEGVTLAEAGPVVSPDGSRVVFAAASKGSTGLWIRALDQVEATPIAGTSGAQLPFWSPDGRSLAFFADGKLRRVDLASGTVHSFVDAMRVSPGGDWSRDGVIVYSSRAQLMRIAAAGGPATSVARTDASHFEDSLRYPQFLPDGQHYLYVARSGRPEESAAYVASLDGTTRRLFPVQSKVSYASGHLVFAREGALLAQPFDPSTRTTRGEPTPIVRSVEQRANSMLAFFSVSANGVLAYRAEARARNELRWLDRTGRTLGSLAGPEAKAALNVRLSPEGDRVAFDEFDNRTGVRAVWIADVRAGTRTRLTFSGSDWAPVWSPDGQEIAFRSHRDGTPTLYRRRADGAGADTPMLAADKERMPVDWSGDGRYVLYQEGGRLFALPLTGGGEPLPLAVGGNAVDTRFSPDGRYFAYGSDESGQLEVYVEPFPPTGARWQVSSAGGAFPRWRGDGRELYFIDRERMLVAVATPAGASFRAGAPRALFEVDGTAMGGGANKYDVTRDGQRFLVNAAFDPPAADPIIVVLNWTALLPR
jgi:Tol biopolymer transport system component